MDLSKPSTQANLESAFGGESMANRKYLFFADVAKKLGHNDLAKLFRDTAAQETEHAFDPTPPRVHALTSISFE